MPITNKVFSDTLPLFEKEPDQFGYVLLGVPFDRTSSFRFGARKGPSALREASYNYESYHSDLDLDLQDLPIFDAGDIPEPDNVEVMGSSLLDSLGSIVAHHDHTTVFPIILGGEHSLTPFVLRTLLQGKMETDEKIGVLYLDAHLDMRDEYLGDPYSHACSARRASELVGLENIIPLGVRSMSREESEYITPLIQEGTFTYFGMNDVWDEDPEDLGLLLLEQFRETGCEKIYLSMDMDVFDPSIAPGVGNPEPGGMLYNEVLDIIDPIAGFLIGMDLVETNPEYDKGITALLGARIIREIIGMHFASQT